jgi:hypothetical protein
MTMMMKAWVEPNALFSDTDVQTCSASANHYADAARTVWLQIFVG